MPEKYPELRVLINNAGRAFAYTHDENAGAFEKSTEEFATIYFSLIRLTESFLRLLKTQVEAAIVNVTSIVAFAPSANLRAVPTVKLLSALTHFPSDIFWPKTHLSKFLS